MKKLALALFLLFPSVSLAVPFDAVIVVSKIHCRIARVQIWYPRARESAMRTEQSRAADQAFLEDKRTPSDPGGENAYFTNIAGILMGFGLNAVSLQTIDGDKTKESCDKEKVKELGA